MTRWWKSLEKEYVLSQYGVTLSSGLCDYKATKQSKSNMEAPPMKEPWCDVRNPDLCRTAKDGDIDKRWNLCGKNGRTFNLVNFSLSVKNVM